MIKHPDYEWWSVVRSSGDRRYPRARRLDRYASRIEKGPSVMVSEHSLSYYRLCVKEWRHYLEHGEPPSPEQTGD